MKLYFSPGACSLADHIALIESGLAFETEQVDLKSKTTASGTDYKTINPKGYVPALSLDEGGVLTENIAILTFIGDRAGNLIPAEGLGRYRTLEALAYISTELHKGFGAFFKPSSSKEDKAAAKVQLLKRFALFDERLSSRDYVLGDAFSVADCYLFVMLFWARTKVGLEIPSPLASYYDRLIERPAVGRALADEGLC